MSFQIHALSVEQFQPLFTLSDAELAKRNAKRVQVDSYPSYPCRVSLVDAEIGENVILINYEHLPQASPFRSTHAIYVREHAVQAMPAAGEIPEVIARRVISIRGFDQNHLMVDADVVEGAKLTDAIPTMLRDSKVAYLHLHNAKQGCFAAKVSRLV